MASPPITFFGYLEDKRYVGGGTAGAGGGYCRMEGMQSIPPVTFA